MRLWELTQANCTLRSVSGPVIWKLLIPFSYLNCSIYMNIFCLPQAHYECVHIFNSFFSSSMIVLLFHWHLLSAVSILHVPWHRRQEFIIYFLVSLPKLFCRWATRERTGVTVWVAIGIRAVCDLSSSCGLQKWRWDEKHSLTCMLWLCWGNDCLLDSQSSGFMARMVLHS